jgi:hypothetical protein
MNARQFHQQAQLDARGGAGYAEKTCGVIFSTLMPKA